MKKSRKIVIQVSISMADTFADFLLSCGAKGLREKTLTSYKQHLAAIGKHLDICVRCGIPFLPDMQKVSLV